MLHLYKGKIVVDKDNLPDSPSIRKIVKDYKAAEATAILKYIYLLYDRSDENPLRDFPAYKRSAKANMIAFGDKKSLDSRFDKEELKLIASAIKEYKKEKIDKIQNDIDLYDKKMYEFIKLLKDNQPEIVKNTHEGNGRVSFSTNIDIITTILDNSINIILDKAALIQMRKTGKFSNDLRGGLSPNVKGKLNNINNENN
jgi:hypothetical protein